MHVSRALVAALIGVVAIPTAMTGLFQSIDDDGYNAVPVLDLRTRALRDRNRVSQVRRNYTRAVYIYNELNRLGYTDLYPPTVNDMESIEFYLDPSNFLSTISEYDQALFGSAPVQEAGEVAFAISDSRALYNALPEKERDLIDGYITSRRCPGSIRQYQMAGFYQICQDLLDETIVSTRESVISRGAYLRGFNSLGWAPLRNLKERLTLLQESLNIEGAYVRPPRGITGGNYRPRLDYSQYYE